MSANAEELAALIYPDIPHVPNPTQRERNKRLTNLRRNRAKEIISAYLAQHSAPAAPAGEGKG